MSAAAEFVQAWRAAEKAIGEAVQEKLDAFVKETGAEVGQVELALGRFAASGKPTQVRVEWVHLSIRSGSGAPAE